MTDTTAQTGAFAGRCWVFPPTDPNGAATAINETMQKRVIDWGAEGLYLTDTGLVLQDNQIVVTLRHGDVAYLYVCDSMEVNQ